MGFEGRKRKERYKGRHRKAESQCLPILLWAYLRLASSNIPRHYNWKHSM